MTTSAALHDFTNCTALSHGFRQSTQLEILFTSQAYFETALVLHLGPYIICLLLSSQDSRLLYYIHACSRSVSPQAWGNSALHVYHFNCNWVLQLWCMAYIHAQHVHQPLQSCNAMTAAGLDCTDLEQCSSRHQGFCC